MKAYATTSIIHQPVDKVGKATGPRVEFSPGQEMDLPAEDIKQMVKDGVAVRSKEDVASARAGVSETDSTGTPVPGGVKHDANDAASGHGAGRGATGQAEQQEGSEGSSGDDNSNE